MLNTESLNKNSFKVKFVLFEQKIFGCPSFQTKTVVKFKQQFQIIRSLQPNYEAPKVFYFRNINIDSKNNATSQKSDNILKTQFFALKNQSQKKFGQSEIDLGFIFQERNQSQYLKIFDGFIPLQENSQFYFKIKVNITIKNSKDDFFIKKNSHLKQIFQVKLINQNIQCFKTINCNSIIFKNSQMTNKPLNINFFEQSLQQHQDIQDPVEIQKLIDVFNIEACLSSTKQQYLKAEEKIDKMKVSLFKWKIKNPDLRQTLNFFNNKNATKTVKTQRERNLVSIRIKNKSLRDSIKSLRGELKNIKKDASFHEQNVNRIKKLIAVI